MNNAKKFLSIQAQDFIEEPTMPSALSSVTRFLSIQAQDFIEEDIIDTTLKTQSDS